MNILEVLASVLPEDVPAEIAALTEDVQEMELSRNALSQGHCRHRVVIRVRLEAEGRVGEELTDSPSFSSLELALAGARKRAASGRPGPLVLGGPRPEERTAEGTILPDFREMGTVLAPILSFAGQANLLTDGKLRAQTGEFAIVNSAGLSAKASAACSSFAVQVASATGPGRGFGSACHFRLDKLEAMAAFLAAAAKCQASEGQQPLAAGKYTVILEPAAVADLAGLASGLFFSGSAYAAGLTPYRGLGEKLFSDQLNLWDESAIPLGPSPPIDFEGTARQRLNLVRRGVLHSVCLDNETAARLKTVSSGHAPPPGSARGPEPQHLVMGTGNAMLDDMITSTEKGLLISRFHNLRLLDPRGALVAGTTAHGTLLVEKGRLTRALPDLRFIQSLVHAFSNVEMVGEEAKLFSGLWESRQMPALKIKDFTFLPGTPGS
jgi:predicted Zn-dependent protease